jgi:hypothetical protein
MERGYRERGRRSRGWVGWALRGDSLEACAWSAGTAFLIGLESPGQAGIVPGRRFRPSAEACNRATFARPLALFRCLLYAYYMYIVVRTIRQVQYSTRNLSSGFRIRISRIGSARSPCCRVPCSRLSGAPRRAGSTSTPIFDRRHFTRSDRSWPGATRRWISTRTRANG